MPRSFVAEAGRLEEVGLEWVELGAADLPAVVALHHEALADLPRPGIVNPEKDEYFESVLAGDGHILGVRRAGRLVAYGILQSRIASDDAAWQELGLAVGAPLAKASGCAVAPALRARGLHRELTRRRILMAQAAGLTELYATSAPANHPSWRNLVANDFEIVAIKLKYQSLLRYILHRHGDRTRVMPAESSMRWLGPDEVAAQRALLETGWCGAGWRRAAEGAIEVGFCRPAP
jgi:ribosomal protein S18 acetylase RimI-like enzyme